jgi:hypothetical protein
VWVIRDGGADRGLSLSPEGLLEERQTYHRVLRKLIFAGFRWRSQVSRLKRERLIAVITGFLDYRTVVDI